MTLYQVLLPCLAPIIRTTFFSLFFFFFFLSEKGMKSK